MLDGAVEVGPNMIDHPDFGLIAVFGQETGSSGRNFMVRTQNGGIDWEERVWINSKPARSVEPSLAVWGPGHMVMISREWVAGMAAADGRYWNHTQHVYRHDGCSFQEVQFSTARTNIRGNLGGAQGSLDTADVIFNPISNRIEVLQSHRWGGGLGNTRSMLAIGHPGGSGCSSTLEDLYCNPTTGDTESEPVHTLNLWSIDPDDLLDGSTDWRFDGTLLTCRGTSGIGCRDGLHPGSSVIDLQRGQQHVFVYAGWRRGGLDLEGTGCSLYRISRTLDTDAWRGISPPEPPPIGGCQTTAPVTGTTLLDPHPNPASTRTTLRFEIRGDGERQVEVDVYDVSGRLVRRVARGRFPSGRHQADWDLRNEQGRAVSPGIYFARVRAGKEVRTHKVVVVR
jgi:hypothetical protein